MRLRIPRFLCCERKIQWHAFFSASTKDINHRNALLNYNCFILLSYTLVAFSLNQLQKNQPSKSCCVLKWFTWRKSENKLKYHIKHSLPFAGLRSLITFSRNDSKENYSMHSILRPPLCLSICLSLSIYKNIYIYHELSLSTY